DINYPPGTNWIYIKAKAEIPAEYWVSTFRLAFECVSYKDHFSRLYFAAATGNETTTTVTTWPAYYGAERYEDGVDETTQQPIIKIRPLTTYARATDYDGDQELKDFVLAHPVSVSNDDGRAGTWEIKNLIITDN
ncbi:MAG: hypothetical protein II720_06750, partial [Bacteroidales bacterium]|nr:hypothetical protein [Bacteroidales bacterium]